MTTEHILFLAPASIPVNGAEAIVNVKLLKLLVSKGYCIDLISKKAKWEHYPLMHEKELQEALSSVTVIEVDNKLGIKTLWFHFLAWLKFGVVFKGVHWAYFASKRAAELIKANKYKCVLTKNYPSELLGCWIKRKYGIPWVATWNDPYPHERFPQPYGRGPQASLFLLKRPIIEQMSKYPDAHIFPSERLRDYMQTYLKADDNSLYVIPHIVVPTKKNVLELGEKLRICYIGSLDGPREPWTTLDAVELYRNSHIDVPYEIDFIGTTPEHTNEIIHKKRLDGIVNIYSPVSYEQSIDLLNHYQVAFIIEAPCQEGVFLPSKVSDIMAAGLSVFAISPTMGVLNDLYKQGVVGYFADVTDPASIKLELEHLVEDYKTDNLRGTSVPAEYLGEAIGKQYDTIISKVAK